VRTFLAVPAAESGERMVFLSGERFPARRGLNDGAPVGEGGSVVAEGYHETANGTAGHVGSGAHAVNWDDETIALNDTYAKVGKQELAQQVWDHTIAAFSDIETNVPSSGRIIQFSIDNSTEY
jgi:hypothetical protein